LVDIKNIVDPELLHYCKKINEGNLEVSDFQEDIVLDFLTNIYSGYQQLTDILCDTILIGRKLSGNPVPLDNIKASYHFFYNGKYGTNIPFFDKFEDIEVLKQALIFRWKEKNGGVDTDDFDIIAPLVNK